MFDIRTREDGTVVLSGRLDAASAPAARDHLAALSDSRRLDLAGLEYIASAGLGLLAATQQRLRRGGHALTLTGLNPHLREVLTLAGFESFFDLE